MEAAQAAKGGGGDRRGWPVWENTCSPPLHPGGQRGLLLKGFAFLSGKRFSQSDERCPGPSLLFIWLCQWSRAPVSLRCGFLPWVALEQQAECRGRRPLQPCQSEPRPGAPQALTTPHALLLLGGAGCHLERWGSMGPGGVVSCLARPLPTTPMAMKMGISWIVYTIVCAKKSRRSVRKCVVSVLPLRPDLRPGCSTHLSHAWEPSGTLTQRCGGPPGSTLGIWGRLRDFSHGLVCKVLEGPVKLYLCKAFACSSPRHPST